MSRTARGSGRPTTVQGVEADLLGLPASPAGSGLAASALALAHSIDHDGTPAAAKAASARALVLTLCVGAQHRAAP